VIITIITIEICLFQDSDFRLIKPKRKLSSCTSTTYADLTFILFDH